MHLDKDPISQRLLGAISVVTINAGLLGSDSDFPNVQQHSFSKNSEVNNSAIPQKNSNLYSCNMHESWLFP